MNERAEEYRTELEELRSRGGGRWRAPADLRDEITVWAAGLRRLGHSTGAIAGVIGLSETALGRWLSLHDEPGRLRRVQITDGPAVDGSGLLSIVTPGGYRLEGLDVDQAVTVLRRV